ncbi:MAG: ribose-5-phosphate isomerase RpiA [Methanolinea sp.]|nr:ribose-5-phosphate isomerase RpiA [Methanolinea sp.]
MRPDPREKAKINAGRKAAEMVEDGMVLGLGTGSTTHHFMVQLAERIRKEGIRIAGVPTSLQTEIRARALSIPLTTLDDCPCPDLAVDGADQIDPGFRLVKGRGAALTREKVVAAASAGIIIIAGEEKLVERLSGTVPVEVIPFAVTPVMRALERLGGTPSIREGKEKDGPVITDNGNYIVDCAFPEIPDPPGLEEEITALPGVLECGLFCRYAKKTRVLAGRADGCRVVKKRPVQEI